MSKSLSLNERQRSFWGLRPQTPTSMLRRQEKRLPSIFRHFLNSPPCPIGGGGEGRRHSRASRRPHKAPLAWDFCTCQIIVLRFKWGATRAEAAPPISPLSVAPIFYCQNHSLKTKDSFSFWGLSPRPPVGCSVDRKSDRPFIVLAISKFQNSSVSF